MHLKSESPFGCFLKEIFKTLLIFRHVFEPEFAINNPFYIG